MTLRQWQRRIEKLGELRDMFGKAAKNIKDSKHNTVSVNVSLEECFILCDILASLSLRYTRGEFEFKGDK